MVTTDNEKEMPNTETTHQFIIKQ